MYEAVVFAGIKWNAMLRVVSVARRQQSVCYANSRDCKRSLSYVLQSVRDSAENVQGKRVRLFVSFVVSSSHQAALARSALGREVAQFGFVPSLNLRLSRNLWRATFACLLTMLH